MVNESEDAIHMVPVPQKHLKLVYQTLAHAMAEMDQPTLTKGDTDMRTTAPTRSGTLPFQNRNGVTWSRQNLAKLRKGIRCAAPTKMLDMTAAQPGIPVYFEDVRRELGQPSSTTRVQIGTITKIIKREFDVVYDDANWPVDVKWDEDKHLMYYIMSEDVAKAWHNSSEQ